jgi:hypothetical protein
MADSVYIAAVTRTSVLWVGPEWRKERSPLPTEFSLPKTKEYCLQGRKAKTKSVKTRQNARHYKNKE